jgi:hypothetical protein
MKKVVMVWGMFKGETGEVVKAWGKKNLIVKLASGVEIDASTDHVEEVKEVALEVVRTKTGTVTHLRKVGNSWSVCGATQARANFKVKADAHTATCKSCREICGLA